MSFSEVEFETGGIIEDSSNNEIRLHLQQIEQEYKIPYNMRRQGTFEDPQEEIIQVLEDISICEKNCVAAAGISLYLFDKNDELIYQINDLKQNNQFLELQLDNYKKTAQENNILIQNFEDKLEKKQRKLNQFKQEIDERKQNVMLLEENLENLKDNYETLQMQFLELQSEQQDSEKRQKASQILNEQRQRLEQEKLELMEKLVQVNIDNEDLEEKLKKSRTIEQQLQDLTLQLKIQIEQNQNQITEESQKNENNQLEIANMKEQIEQLQQKLNAQKEENIHVQQQLEMELTKRNSVGLRGTVGNELQQLEVPKLITVPNLLNELGGEFYRKSDAKQLQLQSIEEIDEDQQSAKTPKRIVFYTPRNQSQRQSNSETNLKAQLLETIHIMDGKLYSHVSQPFRKNKRTIKPRKQPIEEYFHLLTQAIKLNSPYMDSICTISAEVLYSMAQNEGVQYQNWHTWIEKQLNKLYMDNYYKLLVKNCKSKSRVRRTSQIKEFRQPFPSFRIQLNV